MVLSPTLDFQMDPSEAAELSGRVLRNNLAAFGICLALGLIFSGYLPGPPETPKRFMVLLLLEIVATVLALRAYLASSKFREDDTIDLATLCIMGASTFLGCLVKLTGFSKKLHFLHIMTAFGALTAGCAQTMRWYRLHYATFDDLTLVQVSYISAYVGSVWGIVLVKVVQMLLGKGALWLFSPDDEDQPAFQDETPEMQVLRRKSHHLVVNPLADAKEGKEGKADVVDDSAVNIHVN